MKMMNRLLAMTLALLLLALPVRADGGDVMATVNGAPVTRAEYEAQLYALEDEYAAAGLDVTSEYFAPYMQASALMTAMERKYLDEVIAQNGLALTDENAADLAQAAREDWQLYVEQLVDEYGAYGLADVSTEETRAAVMLEVLSELEANGETEAAAIQAAQRAALESMAMDWIARDVTVTAEEVRALYDELAEADRIAYENSVEAYESMVMQNEFNLLYGMSEFYMDIFYTPEGYRSVTHILLVGDDAALANWTALTANGAAAEEIAAAEAAVLASVQPQVEELRGRLAEGASFAELIALYSIDPDGQAHQVHAQSIRYESHLYGNAFRDAAMALSQVGDVSAPVVTNAGVHILYYEADIPGGPVPYTAELETLLHEQLLNSRRSAACAEAVSAWMEGAEIVLSDEAAAILAAAQ